MTKKIIVFFLLVIGVGVLAYALGFLGGEKASTPRTAETIDVFNPKQENGAPVLLGSPFALPFREERFVGDLGVRFSDVAQALECDGGVCNGGDMVFLFLVDGEEISLAPPGGSGSPNAAVVGSYIITLLGIEGEGAGMTATLRVEVHDVKG